MHTTHEYTDDTTALLTEIHKPDRAMLVEETPEQVQVTQVRTDKGDVDSIKTTKRLIKKKKGPKEEVTEILTVQKGDETPVSIVTVTEEEVPDESVIPYVPEDDVKEPSKPEEKISKQPSTEKKPTKKYSKEKLTLMKIEEKVMDENVRKLQESDGPQFGKIKLKKPVQKPKQETSTVTLPKFQLKSRIKYVDDWPPEEFKPVISIIGSVKQSGELSRNVKEAMKLKKKVPKLKELPDLEKVELEKPEQFDFTAKSVEEPVETQEQPTLEELSEEHLIPTQKLQSPKLKSDDDSKEHVSISSRLPTKAGDLPDALPVKVSTDEKIPNKEKIISDDSIIADYGVPFDDKIPTDKEVSSDEKIPIDKDIPIDDEVPADQEVPIDNEIPTDRRVQRKGKKPSDKKVPGVDKVLTDKMIPTDGSQIPTEPTKVLSDDKIASYEKLLSEDEDKPENKLKDTPQKSQEKVKSTKIKKSTKPKKSEPEVVQNLTEQETETVPIEIEERPIQREELLPQDVVDKPDDTEVSKITKKPKAKTSKKIKPYISEVSKEDDVIEQEELLDDILPLDESNETVAPAKKDKPKSNSKLIPIKIERKVLDMGEAQHPESIAGQQFTKLKLKKTTTKSKQDTSTVSLPKFQLKSRIRYVKDWPPEIINPIVSFLGSIRQNGILSRNIKEASKIKKKVYKEPELPDIEKVDLEKPSFGYEDIVETKKQPQDTLLDDIETQDDKPEQFTIKPKRPSIKKTEEITEEVTLKKKLKPVRKSSVNLPEITEPETVTFRPKSTKTKEDVEQEFSIHLDSYAEEEISMSSKVKLKPQRQPTFSEEADEASIKFYEEKDGPEVVEVIESDVEENEDTAHVVMPLKKPAPENEIINEEISNITVSRPKPTEKPTEIVEDVSITLDHKPKYTVNDQEEISFDVKPQTEQYSTEELSLSSKIKLKPKRKTTLEEAADETSIRLTQEIEDTNEPEEIILSEGESDDNVEMVILRKSKKPAYEVSELEELSVELKPKVHREDQYPEEQLTIAAKRKPRKPSQLQEAEATMSIAREQEFPDTPLDVRTGDTVFAVYSYVAETDEAINLVEGEKLYILDTTNQDWWFVRKHLTEEKGWVPAQYLMDEANYTLYLQKKLNEKIDKLPVFEKPSSEEKAIAPRFIEKLRPKHTPDGSTVQFECQVEGHPRPQITWFRQTAIIKPSQDFQMYYDEDNVATLVIREVFPEDAGTFTCVAKNAAGFASSTAELTVEAPLSDHGSEMTILSRKSLSRESSLADILEGIPPTFSKRPKAQYVDEGIDIYLECRLVAIPEPDIAWFFKGEEIMPDENVSIATESDMHMYCSVLKISNVKKFQEGTYTVMAVNREGEASLPIVLKIKTGQKEKPQVIEPLKSMIIREGESVVLTTQVVGNPLPAVKWFKNNKPVKPKSIKSDGDTHTITIVKPKKGEDDGVYTLKATNSEGTAETSAVITIEEPTEENAEPPLFTNRFQEITVKEKGTIHLTAKVTGNPVPIITWYRNNQIITPSETVVQNFDGENIELIIKEVDSEIDSGDYKCVAANTAGKASHGAKVTIDVDKVTFIKKLNKNYETEEGKTVVLECHTSHTVSTKWFHNDKEISGMDHREIIQEGRVHKLRIKKTKMTDIGTIKCVVKDQVTSTKLTVRETVPEFVRKLQDFEVKERDVAILEVEINSETADVFWEKDGENIKPKKNKYEVEKRGNIRKLYIRNTSVHDEGEYKCSLRDDSCTAEVTVVELPPEIISRLKNQRVCKGNRANFEIELTKGDALVQWFKDGKEIQFSNHIQLIIDGKKQRLKIYDCEDDDGGEYACEVGNDRCSAKLIVEEPSIDFVLRLPEMIVVPANTDGYLTVEIPDESLEVVWYKKKTIIEDSEKFTLISDGTKRTLIIRKCTEEDQSEYSVCLLDAVCSTKVKVEMVEFSPRIVNFESEYRIRRGNDVTITVQYEASPQPNDEWVVNSKIIKKSKHTKPTIDSKSASLTIKKVENVDAGTYRLKLENNCGEVFTDITLIVLDIPSPPGKPSVLETDETSVNVCWTEPMDLGNSIIESYILEYQEINTTEWISIENIKRTQQYVKNLKTKSSYRFRVFAVNEVGVSESSEISEFIKIEKIIKSEGPTVQKPLKDVVGEPDEDIELTCIFGGQPVPKVVWFKDGKTLKTAKATYVNRVATLIVSASETAQGTYRCLATNEFGEVDTSCTLEVQQKPNIIIQEEEINQKRKVDDEWTVTAEIKGIPKPVVTWYRNGTKIEKSKDIEIITEESMSIIRIRKLKRSHSNKYSVEATNKAGTKTVELSLKVYDKPSKPEGPVIMREISRESVTIEWKPPLDDGGIELTKYAIERHEPDLNKWVKVADVDKTVETYCIQRLNENCEYMFRVMAQNPIGVSDALESEPIVIKTALDVPSPPLGPLGLYGIDKDSLTITWYPSEKNGGSPILDYTVEMIQEGKEWKQVAVVTTTQAKIQKLKTKATYQFRIYARNEIGTSLPYESDEKITIGKTLSPPSPPRDVKIKEITSRSVTLQWKAPESDGGSVITNYIIEYKTVRSKSWTKVITVSGSVYEHCIENIKEKEELVFRISAENSVGISLPTESSNVQLEKHATVPSPPTAPLEIRSVGNNIVMTSWGTPEWDGGAPLLGYNIAIRDVTKTMWMEVGKVDAHTLKFSIRDLSENHTYMIRIYARNEIGLSEPLESDEPFKVMPGEESQADEEHGDVTEATEPTSFSQTTTSWLRDHNMDADIRSYARGSLLRRDEYFFRIWHYAKQLFK